MSGSGFDAPGFCGLDFGTSNCSIGIWRDHGPQLVPLGSSPDGGSPYLPSTVYVERAEVRAMPLDEGLLAARVDAALAADRAKVARARRRNERYRGLSRGEIEARERNLMRHETARAQIEAWSGQSIETALERAGRMLFGEAAIAANAAAPTEGFFFRSPKLFLGSEVQQSHLEVFSRVIAAMIAEVKGRAEVFAGGPLTRVALGHPVLYSRAGGAAGTAQALGIMERCARAAGFEEVAFLPEPLAAAFGYERSIAAEQTVLVVDVGGGTTDCAVVRVRPGSASAADRAADVLAVSGERVGGGSMDFHLAWRALMPLFGKDTLLTSGRPLPHAVLLDAISVDDVPRQESFRRAGERIERLLDESAEPEKVARLLHLWEQRLQFRLVRSAEEAKIALSRAQNVELALDYIEPGLQAGVSEELLRIALESDLARIGAAAAEAVGEAAKEATAAAGAKIECVFLTGGASQSPAVAQAVRAALKEEREGNAGTLVAEDVPFVRGNDFGSVTEGLTRYAHDVFG